MRDGLAFAIVSKGYVYFWAIARAKTRLFTHQAIAWPFARLAIASFYVYSLLAQSRCIMGFMQRMYWAIPVIKGVLHPEFEISMFCVLPQNYQHCFEI